MREAHVVRTTTDKLEDELNKFADAGCPIHKVEYSGGRDWVIVAGLSENDSWHPSNWEAGKPGVLPATLCNIFPGDGPKIPCLYQRNHIGRHHFEDAGEDVLPGNSVLTQQYLTASGEHIVDDA
jgi:hypothetical protein